MEWHPRPEETTATRLPLTTRLSEQFIFYNIEILNLPAGWHSYFIASHVVCERSLEFLFGLGGRGKIKFLARFRIVRAQMLPSGMETGRQNCIAVISIHLYDAALKSDTSFRRECTRSAMSRHPETMASRKILSPDEIAHLLREISEDESDGGELSCSNLDSDEDTILSESDCEENLKKVQI
ncbi:hypothetical protein TNCV_4118481 [Trichonephila clavipes]|nr:hypothetical protein TNCV_4118481 [Trichonephila clavipes]